MAVFRVERTRDYTVMCNHHLKDSNLSLKAKGLLSMMLSLPDEWNYTTRGLAAICKEGVDAIGKTLKELELAGYIIRRQLRGKDGRISDTEYTIFEKPRKPSPPDTTLPDTENPYLDNPDTEAPDTDNPAQLNTKKSNTQKSNTDLSSTHSFFLPAADGMTDGLEKKAEIREQIEYDILCQQYDRMQLDELVEIMLEVAMNRSPTVKIGRDAEYPTGFVQQRFEKITSMHIEKVMDGIRENTTRVWNTKAYLMAALFNSVSTIDNHYPKRHGKSYNKWLGDKKKPSHRERICTAIDDALTQKPDSFEALLELLRQAGYEVKGKKVPSLLGGEQKKSIRMDTLGDGYTPADLRAVIAGEKTHTPRKRRTEITVPEKKSGNLLVDIQAKLRAGKGAGYARWATLFNLKQMAQTVAYLQENELLDYTALAEKAAAASARFNDLSAKIKSAETRMAEIAVLRKHIVNYTKSRDTYAAYRKAGYSKKFLAEHESEITLHKAAKNYFDGLGLKKLPTIKALNTEYAELLVEKKAAYADYRKAREDMKELLTAKANIDRILELDKEQEEANERREQEAEQR